MTDFSKILDKAKELEAKMKESQENIKKIRVEGISGSNSIKVILDGDGDMQKIEISNEILKEEKSIVEDLIVAAHNNAKTHLKLKTTEEISKATGGESLPLPTLGLLRDIVDKDRVCRGSRSSMQDSFLSCLISFLDSLIL